MARNVVGRQFCGRHSRAGSKLRSLSNTPMLFHIVKLWSVRLSVRTVAFHAAKRSSILLRSTNLGLKVFMDAHSTVTAEEGDRYPLVPPKFYAPLAQLV